MEKKEKKVLFYIAMFFNSLVLIEIIISLINDKTGIIYSISKIYDDINNVLFSPIYYIIWYPICFLFNICYPIYYLFHKRKKKQTKLSFVVYLLSFLPYLYLIYVCFFGMNLGYQIEFNAINTEESINSQYNNEDYFSYNDKGEAIISGFDAMFSVLIVGSFIIPIYPTILFFQVLYNKQLQNNKKIS